MSSSSSNASGTASTAGDATSFTSRSSTSATTDVMDANNNNAHPAVGFNHMNTNLPTTDTNPPTIWMHRPPVPVHLTTPSGSEPNAGPVPDHERPPQTVSQKLKALERKYYQATPEEREKLRQRRDERAAEVAKRRDERAVEAANVECLGGRSSSD